ncbi:CheR family methyltransferase [Celeribacter marinus]|uniref:Chemotaxis protein methyltransferase n=1 Tax=Celeribacter marinus TaxID=1397108 RepID=A0A0P0A977_9RHOB|nr:protein-glutamate O-methyltransferase CheR [Celeribacter marinus]ALI54610.1 chemotaxis protein methyltransferase CheR [Celeribacter marinus]SFK50913.1 chemotaxis protein methyltransferase CheR [Celeribacter marinus]
MNQMEPVARKVAIESDMSDAAYARIVALSKSQAGIVLSPSKVPMVKSRLTRRLRALDIATFDGYLDYLENTDNLDEMSAFISALTTNVTQFFRENHHFEYIKSTVYPKLKAKLARGEKVRIWSAGCSNGQEPYSLAMTFLECDPSIGTKDFLILGSDIDPLVLETARAAVYADNLIAGIPPAALAASFTTSQTADGLSYHVTDAVKSMVRFRQLNLNEPWPMQGAFDLIICRNVMIYFDEPTQSRLLSRFADKLDKEGWLMIGHSERLPENTTSLFSNVGITTYQRAQTN